MNTFVVCCVLFVNLQYSFGYRILGVFPHHGLSHFMMFEPLMVELANRGHEVVVVSRHPQSKKIKNYIDIDVNKEAPMYTNEIPFIIFKKLPVYLSEDLEALYRFLKETEEILQTDNFQNFMKNEPKFDLMITESFNTRLYLALAYKLDIPFVVLSSSVLFPMTSYDVGNPINPSYIPSILSYQTDKMNFFGRLENVYTTLVTVLVYETFFDSKSEEFKEKYFGADLPPLREISKNASLTIVNSHFTLNRPRPLVPSMIEVGGMFIRSSNALPEITPLRAIEKNVSLILVNNYFAFNSPKPLPSNVIEVGGLNIAHPKQVPANIEKFINESEHGVIYFCMGSLLRGETFPEEKRNAFLDAFSKIPQRVLWKWEGEVLPGKSDNIMISKWMPQRDILAHPNVKLFISHGGLLGTSEAVYEGVPVLGIPIFGDQRTNIRSLEASGAGELMDYSEITKEVVLEKITRLINDPKYKENAKELSFRYRDRPMSPLDTAVYWTEYVIRHKGAPHLKTAAVDMPWYQYLLLDVIAFLLLVFISVILILYYSLKITFKYVIKLCSGGGGGGGGSKSSLKSKSKVKAN